MNWITRFISIGDKIKKFLKKRPTVEELEHSSWAPLNCCNSGPLQKSELDNNMYVCPRCNFHHPIDPVTRFNYTFGENNWEEIKPNYNYPDDPLKFVDTKKYTARLKEARKKTKQDCAAMSCVGKLNGIEIVMTAMNFSFMGSSIAQNETNNILTAVNSAIERKCSYVFASASGGMRMQEAGLSLMCMPKLTIAINELKKNKLPFINLYCSPATAGGTQASISSLSDLAIAEKNVTIAFSGRRVIEATVREKLDENIQKSGWVLEKGFLDLELERKEISSVIYNLLSILLNNNSEVNSTSENETPENNKSLSKTA